MNSRSVWIRLVALRWFGGLLLACLPLLAGEKIAVLSGGAQAGHHLIWRGKPVRLIGDSVTQGWMECGTNFDQTACAGTYELI